MLKPEIFKYVVHRWLTNHETQYEYDAANRRTAMVDALNQRTEFLYDDYDRLVKTIFADGTFKTTEYDAAGHKVAEVDQANKRTEFAYDSVGNLVRVTDALNHVTRYGYDANNNRISQTDANNHTTIMAYDQNSLKICIKPLCYRKFNSLVWS